MGLGRIRKGRHSVILTGKVERKKWLTVTGIGVMSTWLVRSEESSENYGSSRYEEQPLLAVHEPRAAGSHALMLRQSPRELPPPRLTSRPCRKAQARLGLTEGQENCRNPALMELAWRLPLGTYHGYLIGCWEKLFVGQCSTKGPRESARAAVHGWVLLAVMYCRGPALEKPASCRRSLRAGEPGSKTLCSFRLCVHSALGPPSVPASHHAVWRSKDT